MVGRNIRNDFNECACAHADADAESEAWGQGDMTRIGGLLYGILPGADKERETRARSGR